MIVTLGLLAFAQPQPLTMSRLETLVSRVPGKVVLATEPKEGLRAEQVPELLWPRRVEPVPWPRLVAGPDGKAAVAPTPIPVAVAQLLALMRPTEDPELLRHRLAQLAELKRRHPRCHVLDRAAADALLALGRPEEALGAIDAALALDDVDATIHLRRAAVLCELGRFGDALDSLVTGLALGPRHPAAAKLLADYHAPLDNRTLAAPFAPRAFPEQDGDDWTVHFVPGASPADEPWLAYALTLLVHRAGLLGDDDADAVWSPAGQRQALFALLQADTGVDNPQLRRLRRIAREGLFDQFLVYEIASRIDPNVPLRQSPQFRAAMRRYVARFILRPPLPTPASPPAVSPPAVSPPAGKPAAASPPTPPAPCPEPCRCP